MVGTTDIYLGTTRDGFNVYARPKSKILEEFSPQFLEQLISYMYANARPFKTKQLYLNYPIGLTHYVKTDSTDSIVMVYLKGRYGMTPMVLNRKPEPCNTLTVFIRKDMELKKHYTLINYFIGKGVLREPWDLSIRTDEEQSQCEEYWATHAIVYDPELVDWDRTLHYC